MHFQGQLKNSPGVHPIVYNRINHCICHGQPVKSKEDMRYILEFDDRLIMVIINKVTMVRKPANPKDHNDNQKHLHYLEIVLQKITYT